MLIFNEISFKHLNPREGAPAICRNFTYLWGAPPAAVTAVAAATMLFFKAFKDCLLDVADEPEVDEEAVTEANEDVDTATAAPEPPEVALIEGVVDKLGDIHILFKHSFRLFWTFVGHFLDNFIPFWTFLDLFGPFKTCFEIT